MLIKFIQDFRGVETRENFFENGQITEFDADMAQRLIDDGRAKPISKADQKKLDQKNASPLLPDEEEEETEKEGKNGA